jgi:hypothetical protein
MIRPRAQRLRMTSHRQRVGRRTTAAHIRQWESPPTATGDGARSWPALRQQRTVAAAPTRDSAGSGWWASGSGNEESAWLVGGWIRGGARPRGSPARRRGREGVDLAARRRVKQGRAVCATCRQVGGAGEAPWSSTSPPLPYHMPCHPHRGGAVVTPQVFSRVL